MRGLDEIRYHQAERLYHLTRERTHNFDKYLLGIPPLLPGTGDPSVFSKPVLIDRRVSAALLCERTGLRRNSTWARFVSPRPRVIFPKVFWIWCQDGRHRANLSPNTCLRILGPDEFPLCETDGIFLHAQYPAIAEKRFIDLPASRMIADASYVACIGPWTDGQSAWIHFVNEEERHERCGSGSYCLARKAA